jgi:hypothetical protein
MHAYARWLFGIAAAFNLAVGAGLLFLRPLLLSGLGFDPVHGTNIIIANLTGMFIVLFGYCYLLVAIDPVTNRPFISVGAIGKLLAIACASSSASRAGLSQRMRLTRGKRIATPDLWRVERCRPSKAIFQHQPEIPVGAHRTHRPEALDRVVAHEFVQLFSSSSVKPK